MLNAPLNLELDAVNSAVADLYSRLEAMEPISRADTRKTLIVHYHPEKWIPGVKDGGPRMVQPAIVAKMRVHLTLVTRPIEIK